MTEPNGTIKVALANRSGHPEGFKITGVVPEVSIELDGNTRYSVNLSPAPESARVEVIRSSDGELLAYRDIKD